LYEVQYAIYRVRNIVNKAQNTACNCRLA